MDYIRGIIGIFGLLGIAYLCSNNRKAINIRTVAWGIGLQIVLGILVLKTWVGYTIFKGANAVVIKLLGFVDKGSGFIIDQKGYLLTKNHVIAKAQKIRVTLADGRKLNATLVGRYPASDLAVIKILSGNADISYALGDLDQVQVGRKAIAIGIPFGLSHTLTRGIRQRYKKRYKDRARLSYR